MIGKTISHYKITEKIGDGGMGIVYKAHDTKLDRFVALKFLPYHFTLDDEANKRFINEAKTASSLQHNNICTVHEIGGGREAAGGRQYICMDFYDGETLKQKIEGGRLNVTSTLDIINQMAEGLRAAHEKGIIHRDIKPSNIFVTKDGTVKILDFGLAKGRDTSQVTQLGATVGTVAYMSPEQLTGSMSDNRTDIWSFGVVLFEMLCGKRPFTGDIDQAIIYSIINEDPDPVLLESKDVDIALKNIAHKCLEKSLENRYQTINELIDELKSFKEPSGDLYYSPGSRSGNRIRKTLKKLFRYNSVRAISAILVLMFFFLMYRNHNETIIAKEMYVALLQIKCDSSDPEEDEICTGLHDYLTIQLYKMSNSTELRNSEKSLSIVPSSEIRDKNINTTKEAMSWFDVNYTISVSVRFFKETIEAYIELINAEDGDKIRIVRSGSIQDTSKSRKSLQKDISIEIYSLIDMLNEQVVEIAEAGVSYQPDAFKNYLQGKNFLKEYESIDNLNEAIKYFYSSVNADTNYARAYTGLAEAYYRKYKNEKKNEWADSSTFYSYKALSKDEKIYESHISLGMVHSLMGLYKEAILDFKKAIEIDIYCDAAYRELTRVYNEMGKPELAEETVRTAIKIDPDNWANYNYLGKSFYNQRKLDSAKNQFKKVIELRPRNVKGLSNLGGIYFQQEKFDSSILMAKRSIESEPNLDGYYLLGTIYYYQQKFAEAIQMYTEATKFSEDDYQLWGNLGESYYWSGKIEESMQYYKKAIKYCELSLEVNPKDTYNITNLAGYYARTGNKEKALELNRKAIRYGITDTGEMYTISVNYEGLGDRDNAIKWITKAIEGGYPLAEIERYPGFTEFRKDVRYRELLDSLK